MLQVKNFIKSNWALLGGLLVLIVGFQLMSIGKAQSEAAASKRSDKSNLAPLVEYFEAQKPVVDYEIKTSGRLTAQNMLKVIGEVTGKIEYLSPNLHTGGRFEKGELMARVDPSLYKAEAARAEAGVLSARAAVVRAKANLKRVQKLEGSGNASEAALDAAIAADLAAEAGYKQAVANQTKAQEMLARTEIRAPFPAQVVDEFVSLGSFVSPGVALIDLMDTNKAEVAVSIKKDQIHLIRHTYFATDRQPLPLTMRPGSATVGDLTLEGKIKRLSPAIDPTSKTVTLIAEFSDVFLYEHTGRVFARDFVEVIIPVKSPTPVFAVPDGSLRKNAYVWMIDENNQLVHVNVTPLGSAAGKTWVSSTTDFTGQKLLMTNLPREMDGIQVRFNAQQ